MQESHAIVNKGVTLCVHSGAYKCQKHRGECSIIYLIT